MEHSTKDCPRCTSTYNKVNNAYDDHETDYPNYMDYNDPEMDGLPEPTIQPQVNLEWIKAQLEALDDDKYNDLIRTMEETHPQHFPNAWLDRN